MNTKTKTRGAQARTAALEMAPGEFRQLGHGLVDQIADFLAALPEKRLTPAESAAAHSIP